MRIFFIVTSFFFLLSLDVVSKNFFLSYLWNQQISLLWDIITLQIAKNTGIAFSIPLSGIALQFLTVVIIAYLLRYYWKIEYPKKSKILDLAYVLIFSGALSHAYERLFVWHVIDFIGVKYFAIFNFADIFISVWSLLLLFVYVIHSRKHR